MNPAQDSPTPKRPPLPSPSTPIVLEQKTALDRLHQMQQDRKATVRNMLENWQGWLFSILFHAAVFVLLAVFIVAVPAAIKDTFVLQQGYDDSLKKLTEEPLDDLFKESPVDANTDDIPSVDANKDDDTPGYTDLDPGAPEYMTMGGHLTGIGHGGGGGHHLAGTALGGYARKLRETGLDIVFVFDSTGSMGGIISETKSRIRMLMKVVTYLVPEARVGIVTYRDLKEFDPADYEYTTKAKALTKDVKSLEAWLREIEAIGGGDQPEAIYQGLDTAMNTMAWNQGGKKIIILFGDAPPRPENGGLNKVYEMCVQWHKRTGGIVSCIDTSDYYEGYKMMPEFAEIAKAAGGDASPLKNERDIIKQLCIFIFGAKYEREMENVFNSVLKGPEDTRIIEGD